MKLSKLFAGQYELHTTVDGYKVRVEASYGEMMRGFNVAYFINDELIFGFRECKQRAYKYQFSKNRADRSFKIRVKLFKKH